MAQIDLPLAARPEIRRRREKTIQTQSQIQKELLERVKMADDETEREKFLREAQKAEKKVKTTRRILEQGDAPEEIREVTPMAPNLEGGTMSTFQSASLVSPEALFHPNRQPHRRYRSGTTCQRPVQRDP